MRATREMVPARSGISRGHREHGIHRDRHGQFAAGTVVDDSALGRNFRGALLLVLRALLEITVAENLQIDQAEQIAPAQSIRIAPSR